MSKKIIFFAVLVILAAAGVLGFWYWRDSIFSKEILRLEILGPDTAKAGDEIEYTVKYKNNGNFTLETPKLIFQLPDNSLTEDGKLRLSQDVGDIYPGVEGSVTFKTRLLGKEGDLKTAHAWLSYVPKNLSARYEGDTTLTTKIDTVPITFTYDVPSKIEKGKEISYAINYFSNIDYPLENLSIKIDSTDGFNLTSSSPISLDNTEWKLAVLQKAQGGRISFRGLATADSGSHLNFSAHLGMWQDGSFLVIKDVTEDVEIISPLLFVSEQINNSSNYTASPGQQLHYDIFFRNIGASPFDNIFALARLSGAAFDLSTLQSDDGQVRQNDNLIVFDFKQIPALAHLLPQQEAKVSFDVKLKNNWAIADSEKNNTILKNEVDVSDIHQEFDAKVNSNVSLSQKAYFSPQAGITNSGPVPPQVNKATTYTIVWQAQNSLNDVKNVKVRAVLPQGVVLTAKISPDTQLPNFSLDSNSRQIVWSAGDFMANAPTPLPSIAFQVSLTPSFQMQGKLATIIGQATISGEDQATGAVVSTTAPAVSTDLPDDQAASGGGMVK